MFHFHPLLKTSVNVECVKLNKLRCVNVVRYSKAVFNIVKKGKEKPQLKSILDVITLKRLRIEGFAESTPSRSDTFFKVKNGKPPIISKQIMILML